MFSNTGAEDESDKLLSNFLQAVKVCQVRFGGHTELATEEDPCIGNLCQVLESIFMHGLSNNTHKRGIKTMQHMKNLVSTSWNSQTGGIESKRAVAWWFIRELLTQNENHRFMLLKNVLSDTGRLRAWIRSLLNEHSLERYINIILSEEDILCIWYEPWAILRNQERASMLPNVAAGLDTILFAINIDNQAFDDVNSKIVIVTKKEVGDGMSNEACLATVVSPNPQDLIESGTSSNYKKRKKRVPCQVVSFDEDYSPKQVGCSYYKNNSCGTLGDNVPIEVEALDVYLAKTESDSNRTETPSRPDESSYNVVLESVYAPNSSSSTLDNALYNPTHQPTPGGLNTSGRMSVGSLQPVSGSEVNLLPLSPDGEVNDFYIPADSISLKSYQDDNDHGIDAGYQKRDSIGSKTESKESNSKFSTFTLEELRTAVLEISRSRDSAEEKRNDISELLTKQIENAAILKAQMGHEQATSAASIDHLSAKVKSLTRENELLRHQLKKYVSAVQMLRRDEIASNDSSEDQKTLSKHGPDLRDYHDEALAYESKLIQVAEMHGELMEFNERLQKLLRVRESQAHQLREELVKLRGPFPQQAADETTFDDTISIRSDLDAVPVLRTLINVWIPTAFLAGPPADTHHVYQIYIRINEDEWNVYRRFAQFYELHSVWKKKFAIVKTFDFPKKKTFGYKDIGVVEDRRTRLQEYLRKLINFLLTEYSHIATAPSKSSLTDELPFLIDQPTTTAVSSQQSRVPLFSRLSASRTDQSVPNSPLYNGL